MSEINAETVIDLHLASFDSATMAAKRPFIAVKLGKRTRRILYDTGAAVNLLDYETFQECQEAGQVIQKLNGHRFRVTAANGEPLTPIGVFMMSVTIGPRPYTGPFVVVDSMNASAIVGIKAITDARISYDTSENCFIFEKLSDEYVAERAEANRQLLLKHNPPQCDMEEACKPPIPDWDKEAACYPKEPRCQHDEAPAAAIRVHKALEVGPSHGGRLRLQVTDASAGFVWGNQEILASINGQDALLKTDENGCCSVLVANYHSTQTATWARGQAAGAATLVSACSVAKAEANANVVNIITAPGRSAPEVNAAAAAAEPEGPSVQQQIDEATKHLEPAVRKAIREAVLQHEAAISKHKYDLGFCNLYEHAITLSDETPVFHKQFPIPLEHAPVIKEQVQQWIRLGVVEPAKSPYNSPIFCVKKKGEGGYRLCLDYRGGQCGLPPRKLLHQNSGRLHGGSRS